MLQKTEGIVLNRIKYNDKSIICTILTKDFGKLTFMIYISNSKASKTKVSLLQPLYILNIELNYKESSNFQKMKEFSLKIPFKSIPFSHIKKTTSLFLSEFINKTLKEDDKDIELYLFLSNTINVLDETAESIANFHVVMLFKMLIYLGIHPENTYSESKKIFDFHAGKFIVGRPLHTDFADEIQSEFFYKLFNIEIEDSHKLVVGKSLRSNTIELLIDYCNIHLDKPGKIKSLDILRQIYS